MKRIHFVFSCSAKGCLKYFFQKEQINDHIEILGNDCSVGPLYQAQTLKGQEEHNNYIKKICLYSEPEMKDEIGIIDNNLAKIQGIPFEEYDKIIVWYGNSCNEYILLAFLSSIVPIEKLYCIDLAKIERFNTFYPLCTAMLSPQDIKQIYDKAIPIPEDSFAQAQQLWQNIINSHAMVRTFNKHQTITNSIEFKEETYYDDFILSKLSENYTKAARIVGEVLASCRQDVGDSFIAYRLRTLTEQGFADVKGDLNRLRTYEVKSKS